MDRIIEIGEIKTVLPGGILDIACEILGLL